MDSSPGPTTVPAESGAGAWTPIPEQRVIIEAAPQARLLVVAPPGTGKTAVACARVGHLLRNSGVAASNVLIVSFTRTAVAEIRARIERHVGPEISVSAMPITTVDSQAWALQYGFSEDGGGSTNWVASDYDLSIARALDLLAKRSPDAVDFLSRFEHIVVDEAQDLVGDRLALVSELIKCLPSTCGVTVFADFLQAIYDFNTEEALTESITSNVLRTMLGPEFIEKRLTHLHRFKNEKLAAVLTQVRTLLESSTLPPTQRRACVKELLEREKVVKPVEVLPWEIHEIGGLRQNDGLLILFRSRAEVLCASGSLCQHEIPHRVRMSGLPDCMHPWIGRVFTGFVPSELVLSNAEFLERCAARGITPDAAGPAWETLRRLARRRDGVEWRHLRARLARSRPPVEACYLDLGTSGPTLGTVHASKGREARKVMYCMPPEGKDTFEELRVDYVACTRGSESVHIGTAVSYVASDHSGRAFRFEQQGRQGSDTRTARIEVGRLDDFVDESVLDGQAWEQVQEHLWHDQGSVRVLLAQKRKIGSDWHYGLSQEVDGCGDVHHGWLSNPHQRDVYDIGTRLPARPGKRWVPGSTLYDIYRVAVRTVVMAEDDPRLGAVPGSVRESGFFLVPVVRGWSRTYFNSK